MGVHVVNCFQIGNLRSLKQQIIKGGISQDSCELLSNWEFTFFETAMVENFKVRVLL